MKQKKVFRVQPLSKMTESEIIYYELINKYIIDNVLSIYDKQNAKKQENQEIYTLRIPKPRHWTLDFISTKIFRRPSKKWIPFKNTYTNHKFKLKNGLLSILVQKNVSKDTNIFYYTSANEILALQNYGLTKSQAITSQIIEILGEYNLIVEERRIKSNIVTNKTELKKFIVSEAQKDIRLLQPIERLICGYYDETGNYISNVKETVESYANQLGKKILQLKRLANNTKLSPDQQKTILSELGLSPHTLSLFYQYDKNILNDLIIQLFGRYAHAKQFAQDIQPNSTPEKVSDQLQAFILFQLNENVRSCAALNELITTNSDDSLFRGKLRNQLIEADLAIARYIFDPFNPITREHQSDYRVEDENQKYGENKVLYQSRMHAGHSKRDQERVLLGITALDEAHKGSMSAPKIVRSAAWNNFSSRTKDQKLNRFAAWIITTILHIPLVPVNIVVTTVSGKSPIARYMQKIEDYINFKFGLKEKFDHDFYQFSSLLGGNNLYTSTLLGKMLNHVVNEFTSVIVQAPKLIYQKIGNQIELLKNDFRTGLWSKLFKQAPIPVQEVNASEACPVLHEKFERIETLVGYAKTLNLFKDDQFFKKNIAYALPKKSLDPYIPNDLLSSAINGLTGFLSFFKDSVIEKNPYIGFIAAIAYACGGASVIAPAVLKALLLKLGFSSPQVSNIVTVLQDIGKPLAKGNHGQAIASGYTLAQAMSVSMNTMSQGFDSALFELIDEVRKEPLLYTMGIGIAYGFGHLFTDILDIPGFTSFLQEDMGTTPSLCKIMIGAKLGFISLETALPEDEQHQSILATFLSDMAKNLVLLIRLGLSPLSLSAKPWADLSSQMSRALAILLNAGNRIAVLLTQCLVLIPKTLLEVTTTTYANAAKGISKFLSSFYQKDSHAIFTVGNILRAKDALLHIGARINFFFRENLSRRLERSYSKAVKSMEGGHQQEQPLAQDYSAILKQLKIREAQEVFCADDLSIFRLPPTFEVKTEVKEVFPSLPPKSKLHNKQRVENAITYHPRPLSARF